MGNGLEGGRARGCQPSPAPMRVAAVSLALVLAGVSSLPAQAARAPSGVPGAGVVDPHLPPRGAERTVHFRLEARDAEVVIAGDVRMRAWTFNGTVPAPMLRARVGDTVRVTFTNRGTMPHSIDFHAARIDWKTAFRTIAPGQSLEFTFKPRYAGAFLYHCGTPPVLLHMGSGMYGALVVDPIEPLPEAREFVLVYSEFYVRKVGASWRPDYPRMLTGQADYAAFNGRAFQYRESPLRVRLGERVRIYLVNAGPRRECAFHVIGQQFDTLYPASPPQGALHGVQTYAVPPGGGAVFEILAEEPGTFPFVNHDVGHGDQGALGLLIVEG